jgi:hypothetical protein
MSTSSEPDRRRYTDEGAHAVDRVDGDNEADRRTGARIASADRDTVVAREKERYGGIKWGSAFFGWLTATGTTVILTGLLVASGVAVGVSTDTSTDEAQSQASTNAGTIGLVGGILLLVVLLVAYYCGGYVAGRMARFNGLKQGIGVWVWAIVIAVLIAVATAALGNEFDVLDRVGGFPRLPIGGDDATTGAIVAVVIAVVAALVGAILGGLAGMRFHRKVDKAGFGH